MTLSKSTTLDVADAKAGAMLLNRVKGDPTQQFERRAGGRNIDVEHLCDDRRPAVDEVDPTIHDAQRLARLRRLRLFEEYERVGDLRGGYAALDAVCRRALA